MKQSNQPIEFVTPRGSCRSPRNRPSRWLAAVALLGATLLGMAQTSDPIVLSGPVEDCAAPPNGVAPVAPPPNGFDIDGNLFSDEVGDWLQTEGAAGGGVLSAAGVPLNADTTFHLTDPYSDVDNNFAGGNKFDDDPNDWSWVINPVNGKQDINHALMHITSDASGHKWLVVSADRESNNGTSYIDFEFLQGTLALTNPDGDAGGFVSSGPHGGRTTNDFIITINFSNGGTTAGVCVLRWMDTGAGYEYVNATADLPAGAVYAAVNTNTVSVPYGAFGNTTYDDNMFAEAAVDLTALIENFDHCLSLGVKTVFIKTKESTSPTATIVDFVAPLPVDFVLGLTADAGPDQIQCANEGGVATFSLTGTADPGANGIKSVTWTVESGTATIDSPNTLATDVDVTGTAVLKLTVVDNQDCTKSDTVTLTAEPSPACSIDGPESVDACATDVEFSGPEAEGTYAWTVESGNATIASGATSRTVKVNVPAACSGSFTLKLVIDLGNGCTSTCTKVVSFADTQDPTLIGVPADVTVECDAVPAPPTVTAVDDCNTVGTVTFEEVRTDGSCADSYTLTRTWSVSDSCGNSTSRSQVITVVDTTKPVLTVPDDATVECSAVPSAGEASATDNCDSDVDIDYLGEERTDGDCADSYTLVRTWRATDNCGNTDEKSQTLTVVDTTAPSLAGVPPNLTVECDAVPDPAEPTASDNCDSDVAISFSQVITPGDSPSDYTITRTWVAEDNCGNKDTQSQVITVRDSTQPVISGVPEDETVECDTLPPQSNPTATDNCGGTLPLDFSVERIDGPCADSYTLKRTWTATDASGNVTSVTQTITVVDTTDPVLTVPADVTVECNAVPAPGNASASDNCDEEPTVTYKGEERQNGDCPFNYVLVRTWEAEDNCGNKVSGTQTITVQDTQAPSIAKGSIASCYASLAEAEAAALAATTASDTCGSVTKSVDTEGTCNAVITVTATDSCGNSDSVSYNTRIDNTKPVLSGVPSNASFQCVSQIPNAPNVTANDNCDGTLTPEFSETRTGDICAGITIVRTWSAVDTCGNSESKSQTITVRDTTAPSLTVPADLTLQCGDPEKAAKIDAWLAEAGATDNCGTPTLGNNYSPTGFSDLCGETGQQTVTFTATDGCNTATRTAKIIIRDTTPPVLAGVPSDEQVKCATELPPAPDVTATDSCDSDVAVQFSEVTVPAVPFNMGFVTTRTWTAVDDCGNSVTATQRITNLYCDDWPDVTGIKFYDANVNGIMDDGESGIAGWRILLYHPDPGVPPIVVYTVDDNPATPEDETGTFVIPHVPPGTYKIAEGKPNESGWKASTPMYYIIDLTDEQDEYVIFGNFCLGPGGGHTPGFWHNKNGYARLMDGGSAEPELAMLSADYHLRTDTGADFDPNSHKSLAAWIRGNAINMAYKLSTHTAAMALNVEANFVNANRLVYSPGCGNTGLGNNFITISDLLANADGLLAAYPLVPSDHPQRGALTCVKDTLDDANNNLNFVQYKPCGFTFPTLPE